LDEQAASARRATGSASAGRILKLRRGDAMPLCTARAKEGAELTLYYVFA
jgi:hypothetical protein